MIDQYAWKVWKGDHWGLTLSSRDAKHSEEAADIFEGFDVENVSIVCWEEDTLDVCDSQGESETFERSEKDECDSCHDDSDLDLFLGDGTLNLCDDCNEMLLLTFEDSEDDEQRGIGR